MNNCLKTGLAFKDIDSNRVYHGDLFYIDGILRIHGVSRDALDAPIGVDGGPEERWMMQVSLDSSVRQDRQWPEQSGRMSGWVDFPQIHIISITPAFRENMERINPTWVKKHAEDYEWWFD